MQIDTKATATATPAGLFTKDAAAQLIGVCPRTIDNLVARGVLTPIRLTRRPMFRSADIEKAIEAARSPKPVSRRAEASGAKVGE